MTNQPGTYHKDMGISAANAIDRAFLSRQSLGDQDLERDLLKLFDQRAGKLVDEIAATATVAARRDLAHGLRGSALAIGAHRVARAAALYEDAARRPEDAVALAAAHGEMVEAVAQARAEIAFTRNGG